MSLKGFQKFLPPKWSVALFLCFCVASSIFYIIPTKTVLDIEFLIFVLAILAFMLGAVILIIALAIVVIKTANRQNISHNHKTAFWVGSTLTSFLLAYALAQNSLVRPLPPGSNLSKFDAIAWSSKTSSQFKLNDFSPRQKMLGDVVRNIIPDKSRDEIEQILGPSLDIGYFTNTNRDLIYALGPERGPFGIDSEWLLIWVDNKGEFERYAIYTD